MSFLKKSSSLLALMCLMYQMTFAQNLVPNGGFEKIEAGQQVAGRCADHGDFDKIMQKWYAISGTPDIWNKHFIDKDMNCDGNIGGIVFSRSTSENITVRLSKPIQKGKKYKIKASLSAPINIPNSGNIQLPIFLDEDMGVFFANKKPLFNPRNRVIVAKPQVSFGNENLIPSQWTQITKYFEADANYEWMSFGLFFPNGDKKANKNRPFVYYLYYDNFSVEEVSEIPQSPQVERPVITQTTIDTFTINHLNFKNASAELAPVIQKTLDSLAVAIATDLENIQIIGHTDNVGKTSYNLDLSQKRAEAVLNFLKNKNIKTEKMTATGKGESAPIASNDTKQGKQKNRRVELIITRKNTSQTLGAVPETFNEIYKFTRDIKSSATPEWDFSYISEYQKAIAIHSSRPSQTDENDLAWFKEHQPVLAKNFILHQTKQARVTMINEAHHIPQHRAFTTSLLKDLYAQGYRYLGLEALFTKDSLINERGYPIVESGEYTKEPLMGDLIRRAMEIGFTVFGYDAYDEEIDVKVKNSLKINRN